MVLYSRVRKNFFLEAMQGSSGDLWRQGHLPKLIWHQSVLCTFCDIFIQCALADNYYFLSSTMILFNHGCKGTNAVPVHTFRMMPVHDLSIKYAHHPSIYQFASALNEKREMRDTLILLMLWADCNGFFPATNDADMLIRSYLIVLLCSSTVHPQKASENGHVINLKKEREEGEEMAGKKYSRMIDEYAYPFSNIG